MSRTQRLIFELSVPGRTAVTLPAPGGAHAFAGSDVPVLGPACQSPRPS